MQKNLTLILVLFIIILLNSCKTSKDMVYLSDTVDQELLEGIPDTISEYIIKANDNLYVDIQSISPELNSIFNPTKVIGVQGSQQNYGQLSGQYLNGFVVELSGNISLPIIGEVAVEGKTLTEAREIIKLKVDEYIKDATVKVRLLSFKITVLGEVKKPGIYYNYNNAMTVLDGISMASGVTDYGNIHTILVYRPTENGSKTFRMDLGSKKFLSSEAFFLMPNDVIFVEPDKNKNIKLNAPFLSLILSTLTLLVLVISIT